MIKLDSVSLQRGSKILLEQASAVFHTGHKNALIGGNGSGKSSLFQLILGQLSSDSGSVAIPKQWRIAHMAQEVATSQRPALDYIIDGDSELRRIEHELQLAERNEQHQLIASLHEQLDNIDGYNAKVRAEQLLLGLGFSISDTQKPANSFSGGWRIRLNLAQALMSPSDLLLLDEPTNHLDLDAELWLEQWLQNYDGSLLLISHDRDFIDSVCDGIVHIEHQQLTTYTGNYSAFERQRAERLAQQQINYQKQQQRISEINDFVRRFRAKATKAKQAQSRLKELSRMEAIAPAHIDSPFDFSFPKPERFSDPLLNISHGQLGYGDSIIIDQLNLSIHPGSRIGLLGANGAGKSTLIKTLATELTLLQGERTQGEHLALGYFSQHQLEALDLDASPALHLQRLAPKAREQEIRNFLGGFNFHGDMAVEPIRHFSGGEKARLALAIVVWQKPNLLLLDEPTNHLDLEMCHALTVALQGFEGAVVVISHDRHLLRNTVDQFLLVANGKAQAFDDDLDAYSRWIMEQRKIANSENKNTSKASETDNSASNKKEQRQQAAEQRKKLAPITNAIKNIEKNMAQLETKLSRIEESLADSSLYEDDNKANLQRLLKEQGELKLAHEQAEEQWFELNDELETISSS
ncbi:ATP-binding cassette domain-containing protein [Dasania sp. GY-MA-18]|uniref:Probable ATP-binding protein YheS n=1 Tax=Dasania phycosphaerae TaxID=2950436 RepID=A0A9J6RIX7_9GAMM|nr:MULTISPECIES: ATP-binding cassette domain-containing protein [Dasania]MCR8922218.1 ATP-binding cassette domain-containing protein [Dasania sp. GY-MA-18]MCZ0864646.1 ATP-binding cassette domain-containing protein [Dasania phycosphaerae]MCZ0868374.1 ATP-binding cassette domain-containing protein [Dasania phycosphaerae]